MRPLREYLPALFHCLLAVLGIALMTAILGIFRDAISVQIIALLYLLPVIFSTTFWGLLPGILASFAAFLAINYTFIPPYRTFAVHHTQDLLALIVFLSVAVVISQLLGRARAGISAATMREREATQLYELSMALGGLQDVRSIARVLGKQVLETFSAERVEIRISLPKGEPALRITLPEGANAALPEGGASYPIATAREQPGSLALWRKGEALSPQEERLLRTFTSQGALAIEHIALAEASNRARILEESDKLKSALLSSVSHELRTPLSTIKAAVTSLRSETMDLDPASQAELLAAIEEETDALNLLVGNLLDSSRLEVGALHLARKWNSLAEIVESVVRRSQATLQHHRLKLDLPLDLPLVPVDFAQMEQVFINLLSNSVKYAPEGTLICVQAYPEDDKMMLVHVSNQGPPVAQEHLERIFDKFYRVTSADRVTGTGLGLSICKGIIEAHGGKIWAENTPGGFTFIFTIPLTLEGEIPRLPEEARSG